MGLLKDANEEWLTLAETAAASVDNAPASSRRLFVDPADGLFKLKNSSGVVRIVGGYLVNTTTTGPTVNDDSGDGYSVGSRWWDTTNDREYVCLDATVAAAVWVETTAAGGANSGWEESSTDATKLQSGRTRIWDAALDGSIILDSSITLSAGAGCGVEVELGGTGEVLDVNSGDGIIVPRLSSDPTAVGNGQIYYNTTTDKFRGRAGGAWVDLH